MTNSFALMFDRSALMGHKQLQGGCIKITMSLSGTTKMATTLLCYE